MSKHRPLTCEGLPTLEGCLSEPGEDRVRQTQPTPRNKLARPDHQKGKEEGREMASQRQRQCGVSEERGVDGSDIDISWC